MAEKITENMVFSIEMLCDAEECGGNMQFIRHQTSPKSPAEPVLYTHCCDKCNVVKQYARVYPGLMHYGVGVELPPEYAAAHQAALEREALQREKKH